MIKTELKKLRKKFEELLSYLAKTPHDKALHFMYGTLIFNFFALFLGYLPALTIIVVIAAGKEYYDYKTPGHECSFMDFVAGVVPGLLQTIIGYIH